jgi:hypothetical protein
VNAANAKIGNPHYFRKSLRTEAVRHFHAEAVVLKKDVADTRDEHARFHRFCFRLI